MSQNKKDDKKDDVFDVNKKNSIFSFLSSSSSVNPNAHILKKQKTVTGIIVGVVVLTALYVVLSRHEKQVEQQEAAVALEEAQNKNRITKNFSAVTLNDNPEQVWRAQESARIETLISERDALLRRVEEIEKRTKSIPQQSNQELDSINKKIEDQQREIEALKSKAEQKMPDGVPELPNISNTKATGPVVINRFSGSGMPITNLPDSSNSQKTEPVKTYTGSNKLIPKLYTVKSEEDNSTEETKQTTEEEKAKKLKTSQNFIPAASSMRVVLLSGLDAPTGAQAQQNPLPVIMLVDDVAQLPNRLTFDAKECRLLGFGNGDLSSERAYIKLESMSCIDEDDVVHELKVKGHVFGEDGKPGVRGRLVSKQGQVLANALIAGIGSGMGSMLSQQSMQYNQTAFGTTATIDPNRIVQGGVGVGVGRAMDRLAQYYISLAEKLFPVVEVDAGRVVDVAFAKGVDLTVETEDANATDTSAPTKTQVIMNQAAAAMMPHTDTMLGNGNGVQVSPY